MAKKKTPAINSSSTADIAFLLLCYFLMTTTVGAMEQTIKLLNQQYPGCKTVVGGAVLTADYAQKIGADCYAKDAKATVDYAKTVYGE